MDLKVFSERLSELIFESKKSNKDVAKESGVAKSSLYEYFKGNKMPTIKSLIKLADYFKVSTDFLVGLEEECFTNEFLKTKPFAERFNEVLSEYKISRYKVEKSTPLSESTLYYWAKGKTSAPTLEKLIEICTILNCSLDYLLGRTKTL